MVEIDILKRDYYKGHLIHISALYTYKNQFRASAIIVKRFNETAQEIYDNAETIGLDDEEINNLKKVWSV